MALLKKTPILYRIKADLFGDGYESWWYVSGLTVPDRSKWIFCADKLREVFDIPKKAKKIWLSAYDGPSENRVIVRLFYSRWFGISFGVEGLDSVDFTDTVREELKKIRDKGFSEIYVSCEYEAATK